ncbi:hypothetical protein JHK87_018221 [Glycine soja]|nr:hypothetical protein JHK87_018221 [Glycine soja]
MSLRSQSSKVVDDCEIVPKKEMFERILLLYIARANQKHPEAAVSYSKSQQIKAQLLQKQQEQELQNTNQNQQIQLLLQKHAQKQQCLRGARLISGSASCPISNDPLMRQNGGNF